MLASGPGGSGFVALTNLDSSFAPGGPGMLVRIQPDTGVTTVILLGGDDDHACTNSGVVRNDGNRLLAVCAGSFAPDDLRGRAVVEVDPATNARLRIATPPAGFQPSYVAGAQNKIWVGDFASARLYSLDRTTFAIADGADETHPPIRLPCPSPLTYVSDLLVHGDDLFALCGADDGYLVRLDPQTGAVKGDKVLVGAQPTAMTVAGDGRLAIVNSVSGTLTLVTIGTGSLTASLDVFSFGKSAALQDVRARGQFLYTVASATNTVQKLDLSIADPAKMLVAEVNTGDGSNPWNILPLDDDQAIVSNFLLGNVVGVDFRTGTRR
jgi:DNA-binding beta-propeller fold protein YncE